MVTDLGPKTTIISSSCYSPTCIKPFFFTRPTGLNFVFSKCITTPRLVSSISLHSRRRCGGRLTDARITCILSRLSLSQFSDARDSSSPPRVQLAQNKERERFIPRCPIRACTLQATLSATGHIPHFYNTQACEMSRLKPDRSST
jgi:hypothetical protein